MRIQQYQRQQLEPDTAGGVLRQGAGRAEEGAAAGLSMLEKATLERAVRAQDAKRTTDVAIRTLAMRQQYGEWWAQRSANPAGYATLHQESVEVLNKLGESALKGVDDPLAQSAIAQEFAQFAGTQSIEAETTQIKQQVAWTRGEIENQLYQRRQEVARAPGYDRDRLTKQAQDMLYGAAASGYLSPLEAEKKARAFEDGVIEDELNYLVYTKPDEALAALYGGQHDNLSVDTRQRLIVNAEKRSEALAKVEEAKARSARAENRQIHRDVQDLNFGTYYAQVSKGEYFDLEGPLRAGEIRGEQYRTLADTQRAMQSAGGPGDPTRARALELRAYRGALTTGDILRELDNPAGINTKERDTLLALVSKGAAVTNARDYKEAVRFIDDSLGAFRGAQGSYKSEAYALEIAGLAQRELYTRATSDENFDAQSVSAEIVTRYRDAKQDARNITPRYLSRGDALTAYRRGEIDDRELDNEMNLFRLKGDTGPMDKNP